MSMSRGDTSGDSTDDDGARAREHQTPASASAAAIAPALGAIHGATIVFLTINDIYALYPNDDGVGGLAEMVTLLRRERTAAAADADPANTHVIVTINGDFLWRSELDRRDKGPLMCEVLKQLGPDFIVLGNHEFDFGARYLQELLPRLDGITCLGSNVRLSEDGALFPGVEDTVIMPLANGLRLGLFGVCTTETAEDPFAGDLVVFEDETGHASRCVQALRSQGADVIVALTHMKLGADKQLARRVPGLALILGGHDHEPRTEFVGDTMIHKSGQDALWLGRIKLSVRRGPGSSVVATALRGSDVMVTYEWQMIANRGLRPDPTCLELLRSYSRRVDAENAAQGKLEPLATALTALDGSKLTCRTRESTVGNLVTDALREVLGADVGLIHGGLIKGDRITVPGFGLTRLWLEQILPHPKPVVVVRITVQRLREVLEHMLRRYPSVSPSHPQFSGLRVVCEIPVSGPPRITSMRLDDGRRDAADSTDVDDDENADDRTRELEPSRVLSVAVPWIDAGPGSWMTSHAPTPPPPTSSPIVREVVGSYLTAHAPAIALLPPAERPRLRIREAVTGAD